ncbi:MAG: malonyl-CoA-[acp] transacylase, partial [Pseudomonadota bacterium]
MQKIALLFPGQGSQAVGMGKSFIENFSVASQMVSDASDKLGFDMKSLLLEPSDKLELTAYSQPAILLVSLMAYRVFESEFALKPEFAIGHSLGEISAVASAGALADMDAVYAVRQRGLWMQEACDGVGAGMMVVLGLADDVVNSICATAQLDGKKVWAANFNADGQVVLAGNKADLEAMEPILKEAGAKRC